jgi:hypothetical protein
MLIANSCLAELLLASDMLWMVIFAFENDLKKIQYEDSLCSFRGYLSYSLCALQNYSYFLQAAYRYITIVHPTRLFWQSSRTQIFLISLTWIFSFLFAVPFIFTGEIIYNVENQICQLPLRFSFALIFVTLCLYIIPILMIIFIYLKLIRYVKRMSKRITPINILSRAKRELKMIQQIVLLVSILLMLGLPYITFILISFFTIPPKYHFRIAVIFVDISLTSIMIFLFKFQSH